MNGIKENEQLQASDKYYSPLRRAWLACPPGLVGMSRGASSLRWVR